MSQELADGKSRLGEIAKGVHPEYEGMTERIVALLFLTAILLQVADLAVTEYLISTGWGVEANPILPTAEDRFIAKAVAIAFLLVLLAVLPQPTKLPVGLFAVLVSLIPFILILAQVGFA